jgi:release factor glutamine methyltransferase
METETIPEAPKILGTAKLLGESLNTKFDRRESEAIVRILLEAVLKKPYKWLLMNPDAIFSEKEIHIWNAHAARLLQLEPIQYILGTAYFWGMDLLVTPDVLIPRPETEELVAWILEVVNKQENLALVDIGTGSGCIALALARELPHAQVTAIDISAAALTIAERNAHQQQLDIRFLKRNVLMAVESDFADLDLIVSNPPYIPATEWAALAPNVRDQEPALALKVPDEDPLIYYNSIAKLGRSWLKPGGWLFFEIHEDQGDAIRQSLAGLGYTHIEIRKDLSGRDRMAKAVRGE